MNNKCQVFTPPEYVKELLNTAGYKKNVFGKRIIENACGDGNILKEIVIRYIRSSQKQSISQRRIKRGLENDIWGFEIDKKHYDKCIEALDRIAHSYGIKNVKWNIHNEDFLKRNFDILFDYVVGNPPYITYKELDDETRNDLRDRFTVCRVGKFDYCYAFLEKSLRCLNDSGKLVYLIPASIFKNVFAKKLRDTLLPNVTAIIDYKTKKLFANILISSIVLVCEHGVRKRSIKYTDIVGNVTYKIPKCELGDKWEFSNQVGAEQRVRRFGDYFNASITIATLCNEAYVLKDFEEEEDCVAVGEFRLEHAIVRVGVSPRSLNYNQSERILFPYLYHERTLVRFNDGEFEKNYPEAVRYLQQYADKLSKRDSDKSVKWFEYGRTQALAHLNKPKLLLSSVITQRVKVYLIEEEWIPYSGIYITQSADLPLSLAKEILESEEFYRYIENIGIHANGKSIRITSEDVNNYFF